MKSILNAVSGITLIALVVTIVVLLILASVSITVVFGDNGILQLAKEAGEKTNEAVKNDQEQIGDLEDYISSYAYEGFNTEKQVNAPKLGNGMVPVKYEGDSWVVTTEDDPDWYNYLDKEIEIDGKKVEPKKWANVMLRDGLKVEDVGDATTATIEDMSGKKVTEVGSMFVWIPRYAYSIAKENYHTNVVGTIAIDFMKGTTNTSVSGRTTWDNASGAGNWNIHPAFTSNEDIGGWNRELAGIWVAKFEASHTGCTTDISTGQTNTDRTDLTLQIKPNVTSWRNISIENMYTVCLDYNKSLNSHLIKNSEWGAVAYLTQSIYGKNSEVAVNQCCNRITGAGPTISEDTLDDNNTYNYDKDTFESKHSYITENGQSASTTGNIYGIYDMSGGSVEYTASYINNNSSAFETWGQSLKIAGESTENKHTVDLYEVSSIVDSLEANYSFNKNIYGDAVYETSSSEFDAEGSWGSNRIYYPDSVTPFFARGGHCIIEWGKGIWCCDRVSGSSGPRKYFSPYISYILKIYMKFTNYEYFCIKL